MIMLFEPQTISGADFALHVHPNGATSLVLIVAGCPRVQYGRVRCAGFSENGALSHKHRRHDSGDQLTATFETLGVIPFGCEYEVARETEVADGFLTVTVDIHALNHGLIENLILEDLEFVGPWSKLEFLVWGDEGFHVEMPLANGVKEFLRSPEPPIMIRLTAVDGVRIEFATGGDLWRHRCGSRTPGAVGEFVIKGGSEKITFERRVLAYGEDAKIEKRPWRFTNVLAWRVPDRTQDDDSDLALDIDLGSADIPQSGRRIGCSLGKQPENCLASATTRKYFRNQVRRASQAICFKNAGFELCTQSAHLERANKQKLEHFDLEDWVAFYIWGNRQLLKNGHWLTVQGQIGRFADSVSATNLASRPRILSLEPSDN